jgi:hypothetical protein
MLSKLGDMDITEYPLIGGYYTLGWLQTVKSECEFITHDEWVSFTDYRWLDIKLQDILRRGKIACVVPWDEDILAYPGEPLAMVLNQYKNESVYLIHQLPSDKEELYSYQNGIECKLTSLPWWLLNDTLTYYKIYQNRNIEKSLIIHSNHQYLCMIGNNHSSHKYELIEQLYNKNLHNYGLITVGRFKDYPASVKKYAVENKWNPYKNLRRKLPGHAAQSIVNGYWISTNVENFLHIEETYDMPLIINAETTNGIFMATEKSIWPILLGKMYLLWGAPHVMSWIQQFHDVKQIGWANCNFDNIGLDYTKKDHDDRLHALLDDNRYLIMHARDLYKTLEPRLEVARWTFGKNLSKYCYQQLEKIV